MKRFILCILLISILTIVSITSYSETNVGDVVGNIYYTDIVTYVNGAWIKSFSIDGRTVIIAEDLKNYSFYVSWNEEKRELHLAKAFPPETPKNILPIVDNTNNKPGDIVGHILHTDIVTYFRGEKMQSYSLNGYTAIVVEDLADHGMEVTWNPSDRELYVGKEPSVKIPKHSITQTMISAPEEFKYHENSADGITLTFIATNLSGKTINYITYVISTYNRVGDPSYDQITGEKTFIKKYVGPIEHGEQIGIFNLFSYQGALYKIVIDGMKLEFSDGTEETILYGYSTTDNSGFADR